MAHLGEDALRKLVDMSTSIKPLLKGCLYIIYVKAKLKENPYTDPIKRGTYPLELIYIDIAEPFLIIGYRGAHYWAKFINNFVGYTKIIPLYRKEELLDIFFT